METGCHEAPGLPQQDRHGQSDPSIARHHHSDSEGLQRISDQQLAPRAEGTALHRLSPDVAVGLQQEIQDLRVEHPRGDCPSHNSQRRADQSTAEFLEVTHEGHLPVGVSHQPPPLHRWPTRAT